MLLPLREAATAVAALTPAEAEWLSDARIAACRPTRKAVTIVLPARTGTFNFEITAGNIVGLLSRGELTVQISPKLPVDDLLWLAVYGATGIKLDENSVGAAETNIAAALGQVLSFFIGNVVTAGIPRGYWTRDESASVLRGRLRFNDQLNRHLGRQFPLETSYDEFSANIPENQIMRTACIAARQNLLRAARLPALSKSTRSRLQEAANRLHHYSLNFADAQLLQPGVPLPRWQARPQNTHARAAIHLSELLLRNSGADLHAGNVATSGIVLDLKYLFETALARGFSEINREIRVTSQQSFSFAEVPYTSFLRPDLLFHDSDGRISAVADAKYKEATKCSRDDLYQLFTYAQYFRLPRAHLIYGESLTEPRVIKLKNVGVEIVAHGISLAHPATHFLPQLRKLAKELQVAQL